MSGNLTTYGATAILNGTAHPTALWAKGHLGDPGSYAVLLPAAETRRVAVTLGTAVDGVVVSSGDHKLTGASATEEWTHLSLWDASSGGNPWWVIELDTPVAVAMGNRVNLLDGALSLELERWT